MKPKLTFLIIVGLAFLGFGLIRTTSKIGQDEQIPAENRLHWHAQQAKAKGQLKTIIAGPIIDYAGVDMGLEETLQNYSVVLAEPLELKSYPLDGDKILSWCKFKIIEVLSEKPPNYCDTCAPYLPPPPEMLPISEDEFLITIDGGTIDIEGVEVTETSRSFSPFKLGKKYLLFVSVTPSRVGKLGAGPSGVFSVDKDSLIEPTTKNSPLRKEIQARFDGKLSRFKSHLKG